MILAMLIGINSLLVPTLWLPLVTLFPEAPLL